MLGIAVVAVVFCRDSCLTLQMGWMIAVARN